jgi:hypothetical protein
MSSHDPDKSIEKFIIADKDFASQRDSVIPILVQQFYIDLGRSNGIRLALLDTGFIPPRLKTDTESINTAFSVVIDAFVEKYNVRPRVTLCLSDGVVFYDSNNGTDSKGINDNYYSKTDKVWNLHTTRKEWQLGTMRLWGSVSRLSSSITSIGYDYYAFWLSVANNDIGVRFALQDPLPVL